MHTEETISGQYYNTTVGPGQHLVLEDRSKASNLDTSIGRAILQDKVQLHVHKNKGVRLLKNFIISKKNQTLL